MPRVQPNAVTMLERIPRDKPAEMVSRAPVPGVATMTKEVIRNARLTHPSITSADVDPLRRREASHWMNE